MTGEEFMAQWLDAKPYIEAHTSGSTGRPKDIRLLKADMLQSARATNAFFGIEAKSTLASPLSPDYIAGKMMYVRAYAAACPIVQLPVSNDIVLPDLDTSVALLPVVPSQLRSLISQPALASKIDNVLIGGAAPSPAQCAALATAGYRAYISYGMTETCSHVALARATAGRPVFKAMPGISFDTDPDGRLIINAPTFSFGSLVTCDIVDLHDDSSFTWRGRADGVINSGGIKLFPEELEALYRSILGERELLVRAAPHQRWGEAVELLIEAPATTDQTHAAEHIAGPDNPPFTAEKIAARLRAAIDDHRRLPKKIHIVPTLPRTPNGKLRRY